MKKIASILGLALFMAVFTPQVQAQIQKHNVLIGGDIMDFNLGLDKGGNFALQVTPKVAWFVKDNIAIGGFLNFGLSTAKDAGESISYGIGALGRYYFSKDQVNLLKHARFFVEGTVGIEGDNPAVGSNTNGLGIGVGPGIAYFITPNIGLEGLLKYNGIIGFGSSVTSNNLNFGLGFQIYLPTKKLVSLKKEIKNQ